MASDLERKFIELCKTHDNCYSQEDCMHTHICASGKEMNEIDEIRKDYKYGSQILGMSIFSNFYKIYRLNRNCGWDTQKYIFFTKLIYKYFWKKMSMIFKIDNIPYNEVELNLYTHNNCFCFDTRYYNTNSVQIQNDMNSLLNGRNVFPVICHIIPKTYGNGYYRLNRVLKKVNIYIHLFVLTTKDIEEMLPGLQPNWFASISAYNGIYYNFEDVCYNFKDIVNDYYFRKFMESD